MNDQQPTTLPEAHATEARAELHLRHARQRDELTQRQAAEREELERRLPPEEALPLATLALGRWDGSADPGPTTIGMTDLEVQLSRDPHGMVEVRFLTPDDRRRGMSDASGTLILTSAEWEGLRAMLEHGAGAWIRGRNVPRLSVVEVR